MGLAAVTNKTTARVGISFAAVLFAGVTGWSAAIAVALLLASAPFVWFVVGAGFVAGLATASFWLARRSRYSLRWLIWPLLASGAAGFIGFWYWIFSTIDWA